MPEFITVCEEAARQGAVALMDRFGRVEVREKGPADLVTEADYASQEAVRRVVLGAFPDHAFMGEEDPGGSAAPSSRVGRNASEFRWIVDPLDGTTNYVHQVPHFSVSLALECSGELLAGCVYDPSAEECFTAVAGQGACLNGRPIRTSSVWRLSDALVSAGFPPLVKRDSPHVRLFAAMLESCQAVRRMGSAALNLSYVAAGRFDAAWSLSTRIWDVAAGVLLVREAGGVVTAPDGRPFVLEEGRFIAAASKQLHDEVRLALAQAGM